MNWHYAIINAWMFAYANEWHYCAEQNVMWTQLHAMGYHPALIEMAVKAW